MHAISVCKQEEILRMRSACAPLKWGIRLVKCMQCCARTGGNPKDALGVCATEMGDPQLALFVARILEPQCGPLTTRLIQHELLPGTASHTLNLARHDCMF